MLNISTPAIMNAHKKTYDVKFMSKKFGIYFGYVYIANLF